MRMNISRRDLGFLFPVFASRAGAEQASDHVLPNRVYHNDKIPYTGDAQKKSREFFHGTTHADFDLQMHETILGAGVQTHAPHKHEHEEIVIVLEGTVEA
jgi:XRE family transcriptional regulator, regulator of sulfur utilization